MSGKHRAFLGVDIFDGFVRYKDHALVLDGDKIRGIVPKERLSAGSDVTHLTGGLIVPGFVDLQVNGGGGITFNDAPSLLALKTMARAHAKLGSTSILPTLITDEPQNTLAAIEAVGSAISSEVPGIIGLHLEGPHLAVSRCGAHDPSLIRPMTDQDIAILLNGAQKLPILMVTLAPEIVEPDQISLLVKAGIIVSIGHTDATYDQVIEAVNAGATCATHLFNAMRQMSGREPGVVGAAITEGQLSAGLIADGVHVHPSSVGAAIASKRGPGKIFLVSDAMAVAGTQMEHFNLNQRRVLRKEGKLTLENGTLAGADLDILTAVRNLIHWGAANEETAYAMASEIPASVVKLTDGQGTLVPGASACFQFIPNDEHKTAEVWQAGRHITP